MCRTGNFPEKFSFIRGETPRFDRFDRAGLKKKGGTGGVGLPGPGGGKGKGLGEEDRPGAGPLKVIITSLYLYILICLFMYIFICLYRYMCI
jgi:hypothetical protein